MNLQGIYRVTRLRVALPEAVSVTALNRGVKWGRQVK